MKCHICSSTKEYSDISEGTVYTCGACKQSFVDHKSWHWHICKR